MNYVVCSSACSIVQMHEFLNILYKDKSSVVQLLYLLLNALFCILLSCKVARKGHLAYVAIREEFQK